MAYELNDVPRFTGTFKNASNVLTDPTAVTFTYTKPDSTSTTLTYGVDGALVKSSTGVYYVDLTLNATGRWQLVWRGTGTVADSDETDIVVGVTHAYCTFDELSAYLGTTASASDAQIQMAINAASRTIDSYCQRRFWLDPTAVARTFVPCDMYSIDVDDIGSSTSLTVATDGGGDGTFETTWAASDYQLLDANAPYEFPEAKPWTKIRAVGTKTFPWLYRQGIYLRRDDRVQVTAKWGWPAVPDSVAQACTIKAARLFLRKNSLQGIAAFDAFGPVRLSRGEDSDVMGLLEEYRRRPVLMR